MKVKKKMTSIEFNSIVNSSLSGEKIFFFFIFFLFLLRCYVRFSYSTEVCICRVERVQTLGTNYKVFAQSCTTSEKLAIIALSVHLQLWMLTISNVFFFLRTTTQVLHRFCDFPSDSRLYQLCVKYRGICLFRNRDSKNLYIIRDEIFFIIFFIIYIYIYLN